MVCRARRAFGECDNAGRDRVNKSDIAGHVADRAGVGRSAAGDAVDAVFEAIGEALARGEDVRIAGFGSFGTRSRPARHRAQSENRREPEHRRFHRTDVQGRQAVEGCRERGKRVVGPAHPALDRRSRSKSCVAKPERADPCRRKRPAGRLILQAAMMAR